MPSQERGQSLVEMVVLLSVLTLLASATLRIFQPTIAGAWKATSHFFSLPSP